MSRPKKKLERDVKPMVLSKTKIRFLLKPQAQQIMEILILMMSSAVNNYIYIHFFLVCLFCYFFSPGTGERVKGRKVTIFCVLWQNFKFVNGE